MAGKATRQSLFLFGAGASAFCGGISPECPPLGNELFDKLCGFDDFFEYFSDDLKLEFRANFETGMAMFRAQRSVDISRFLCLMSMYFLQFRIHDKKNNFYSKFIDLIKYKISNIIKIHFATLNYDLLLDEAIIAAASNSNWEFGIRPLKIHGAPNLLGYYPPGMYFTNVTFTGIEVANIDGLPVQPRSPEDARAYCEDSIRFNRGLAPTIAAYAVGKRVDYNPKFIKNQQDIFAKQTQSADKIVLVGVELNEADTHIWEPIAASKAVVAVVNPSFDKYKAWGERHRRDVRHFCKRANDFVGSDANRFIDFMNS